MSKTTLVSKNILFPFVLITIMFCPLGDLLMTLPTQWYQHSKRFWSSLTRKLSWVQAAFYGGYFTMALPAAYVIKRFSYKTGILVGLLLYAVGALLFYPATQTESYYYFFNSSLHINLWASFFGNYS